MKWLEINGIALRYALDRATGPGHRTPLLLLHELGGTLESWDAILPFFPDRDSLRFDTHGQGMSEKIRGTLDPDQVAADIDALVDRTGFGVPLIAVGCAVGGALALRYAARYPARVAGLVLMAPATGMPPEMRPVMRARADLLDTAAMRETSGGDFEKAIDFGYPENLRDDPEVFESFRARQRTTDPHGMAAVFRMLSDIDMSAVYPEIACPVLVLAGEHDPIRPPPLVRTVADAIAGSRFATIESGHFMAIQTPALVAKAMTNFFMDAGI